MAREGQASLAGKPPSPAPALPPAPPEVCVPVSKEKVLQDFKVLVQKVGGRPEVLLIGETLEGKDIHGLMASFVKDLFSATCQPVHPGDLVKEPGVASPCSVGSARGGCQLIFFLCRASCIKGRQAELHKILREVKQLVKKSPCALVGIITEAKKNEADDARAQLLRLLRGVFPKTPGRKRGKAASSSGAGAFKEPMELENIEVEAEIYVPGQPKGNLAIMKAACRASEALAISRGLSEEGPKKPPLTVAGPSCAMKLLKFFLWTAFILGLIVAVCWYLTENGLLRPIFTSPSELYIFF